jgi:hypothetical protein
MAVSTDGGETFSNKRISANPFIPDGSHFFGDYTNLSAHNGVIRPAWTQMSTNSQSLWTAIVNHDDLLSMEKNTKNIVETNVYPVPNFDNISIKYKLINDTQLTINLLDNNGRLIKTLIDNQFRKAGKNKEVFKNDHIKLSAGIYFIELKTNDFRKLLKLIKD